MSVSISGVVVSLTNTSSGTNQLTATLANGSTSSFSIALGGAFPVGSIVTSQTAPAANTGWFVCDGNNGTINLTNRFIYGWGSEGVGTTGGSTGYTTTNAGSHTHNISVGSTVLTSSTMPSHTHVPAGNYAGYPDAGTSHSGNYQYLTGQSGFPSAQLATTTSGSSGSHTHSGSSDTQGNHNHTVTTVPPYICLYYIQRVS